MCLKNTTSVVLGVGQGIHIQILYLCLVPIQQCKISPFQVKVLHEKSYLSTSAEVLAAKCTLSIKVKTLVLFL